MPPIPSRVDFHTDSDHHIADVLERIAEGLRAGHLRAATGGIQVTVTSAHNGNPWKGGDIAIEFEDGSKIITP